MNRCSPISLRLVRKGALLGSLWALSASISAQPVDALAPLPQRIPPISVNAKRGVLKVVQPPDVLLNGKTARLAPGARIRGTNNLLVMSGSIVGKDLPVRYTLDSYGLILNAWIVTDAEIARDALAPKRPDTASSD
jgi:hypothetical protein